MRTILSILVLAIFPAISFAQQKPHTEPAEADPRQQQIQAATSNAMASLRDQVLRTRLTRDLSVNEFLDRTNSMGDLDRVLRAAQPIGGARWVDDRTCQIRLELPESQVAALLMGIAHTPAEHAPIRPDVLKAKFSGWAKLNFSVVGSSAGGDAIELARPADARGKWSEVSDAVRRSAIDDARGNAAAQMIAALGPIQLDPKTRGADAMTKPTIAAHLHVWLTRQPVTRIEFQDDLQVSVTIAVEPTGLTHALKSAITSDPAFANSLTIDWDAVERQIDQLPALAQGKAAVSVSSPATGLPSVVLPLQPPDWVDQQLQAGSRAQGATGGSRLKVGHAAESDALDKIRAQFLLLHLDANTTLGDAARNDPELKSAVDRAMLLAHTSRVDYQPDGSVKVEVELDLRNAWDALRTNP
jgi:hypothetical protein